MKYWMCEFREQNGEDEYAHRHIYSDQHLEDIKHEGDDHDYRILSHFFHENLSLNDEESGSYWIANGCKLVRFEGMVEVKKKDFKVMELCGVYSVGGKDLRIRWNDKDDYYEEYYD